MKKSNKCNGKNYEKVMEFDFETCVGTLFDKHE